MTLAQLAELWGIGWLDLVEIVLVAALAFRILLRVDGRRALRVALLVALLAVAEVAAGALGLRVIERLLDVGFLYGAFAALIAFQPEVRAFFAGAFYGADGSGAWLRASEWRDVAAELVEAVEKLARARTGAIIAIEREVPLTDYVASGTPIHANVSADLLGTIFTRYSPLHDGAVLVSGDAIIGARCILPLSQQWLVDRQLGTRHRAALGLSEETDALVIVVSEESGTISVAQDGHLERGVTAGVLAERLGRWPAVRLTGEHRTLSGHR